MCGLLFQLTVAFLSITDPTWFPGYTGGVLNGAGGGAGNATATATASATVATAAGGVIPGYAEAFVKEWERAREMVERVCVCE